MFCLRGDLSERRGNRAPKSPETLHGPVRAAACNVALGFAHLLTITCWCQALRECVSTSCNPALNSLKVMEDKKKEEEEGDT